MEAEYGSLRILSECLVFCSMHLGVPFIAPRQLGAVGDQLGRQILPSVGWCTGQSGAPPDSHYSCPVRDPLPYLAHPTVGPREPNLKIHRVHLVNGTKTTWVVYQKGVIAPKAPPGKV